jgi:hypothetical protein
MTRLLDEIEQLLDDVATANPDRALQAAEIKTRMREPLRVAIAGRVKAGKSTLLNALLGEELAPTDAGECTKIVTWYQHGPTYRVTLELRDGTPRQARFTRDNGFVEVDLGGLHPDAIDRIVVEWPNKRLEGMTLIDTPGIQSASEDVSARTMRLLEETDEGSGRADAVLYLMRHLHTSDIDFLEAFRDDSTVATPINAIGILSRADEIGVGRPDAMRSARRIAERYRHDPKLRRLCQTVIAVDALLAATGSTLTQDEFASLEKLAQEPRETIEAMLLSADRFLSEQAPVSVPALVRNHLLGRLGIFGVRSAINSIRMGATTSASKLSNALIRRSGIADVLDDLAAQFSSRRDTLKAQSAMQAAMALIAQLDHEAQADLLRQAERIRSSAHQFTEIQVLIAHRSGAIDFGEENQERVDRLLGCSGTAPHERLGLPAEATSEQIREAVFESIDYFRRRAGSPLSTRDLADAASVIVRTCEGMLVDA